MSEKLNEALDSARTAIVCGSKDWSLSNREAWIYGILVGWNDESLDELQEKYGWTDSTRERLKQFRQAVSASQTQLD